MKEYLTQRGRWCLGLMQILRSPLGPFSGQRLSLAYRVGLIDALLYWATSFPNMPDRRLPAHCRSRRYGSRCGLSR